MKVNSVKDYHNKVLPTVIDQNQLNILKLHSPKITSSRKFYRLDKWNLQLRIV